jgi:predicted DNA-binding WGR domain protein
MNRLRSTDSKLSLDVRLPFDELLHMLTQPYQLYIERTDPAKNMARFYTLAISETLFGEPCLIRRWGRIGASGQSMVHAFAKEEDAVRLFLEVIKRKRARGYRPKPDSLRVSG